MSVVRKTVTFTQQQAKWIKAQIKSGDFTNDSEYLRHLVRQDQLNNPKSIEVEETVQKAPIRMTVERPKPDTIRKVEPPEKDKEQVDAFGRRKN